MTSRGLLTFAPFPTMKEGCISKCSSPSQVTSTESLTWDDGKSPWHTLTHGKWRSASSLSSSTSPSGRGGVNLACTEGMLLITLDTFAKDWQRNKVRTRLVKPNYPVFRGKSTNHRHEGQHQQQHLRWHGSKSRPFWPWLRNPLATLVDLGKLETVFEAWNWLE